jgi:transposase
VMVGHPHNALRRQKEALKLMSAPNNYSSRRAAKKLILPHRTLRRWRQHFDLFGEVPASTWLRNRKGGTIRRKYSRLVTPVVKAYLQNLIHDTPQLYLDEFSDKIFERTGQLFHPSTVHRLLKSLGWSLKKCLQQLGKEMRFFEQSTMFYCMKSPIILLSLSLLTSLLRTEILL